MSHLHIIHSQRYPSISIALDSFWVPLRLIGQWIKTPIAPKSAEKYTEANLKQRSAEIDLLLEKARLEAQARRAELEQESQRLQDRLMSSFFYRIKTFMINVTVGLLSFLFVLLLAYAAGHVADLLYMNAHLVVVKKALGFFKLLTEGIMYLDILLYAVFMIRLSWVVIIRGRLLKD